MASSSKKSQPSANGATVSPAHVNAVLRSAEKSVNLGRGARGVARRHTALGRSQKVEDGTRDLTTISCPKTWQPFGNVRRRKTHKTVRQGAGKYKANQQDRNLCPDSGSAYRGSNPCLPAKLFNQFGLASCNCFCNLATLGSNKPSSWSVALRLSAISGSE
jgi:hypothetical protein